MSQTSAFVSTRRSSFRPAHARTSESRPSMPEMPEVPASATRTAGQAPDRRQHDVQDCSGCWVLRQRPPGQGHGGNMGVDRLAAQSVAGLFSDWQGPSAATATRRFADALHVGPLPEPHRCRRTTLRPTIGAPLGFVAGFRCTRARRNQRLALISLLTASVLRALARTSQSWCANWLPTRLITSANLNILSFAAYSVRTGLARTGLAHA